jgi:hypothetical protein
VYDCTSQVSGTVYNYGQRKFRDRLLRFGNSLLENITPIDPRRFGLEQRDSRYVVTFWHKTTGNGWASQTYLLDGQRLNTNEVIEWATDQQQEASYDRFVVQIEVLVENSSPILVHLLGHDPTE